MWHSMQQLSQGVRSHPLRSVSSRLSGIWAASSSSQLSYPSYSHEHVSSCNTYSTDAPEDAAKSGLSYCVSQVRYEFVVYASFSFGPTSLVFFVVDANTKSECHGTLHGINDSALRRCKTSRLRAVTTGKHPEPCKSLCFGDQTSSCLYYVQ